MSISLPRTVLCACLLSSALLAQGAAHAQILLDGAFGRAHMDENQLTEAPDVWRLSGTWMFNERFGLELGALRSTDASGFQPAIPNNNPPIPSLAASADMDGILLGPRLHVPLTERWWFDARAGLLHSQVSYDLALCGSTCQFARFEDSATDFYVGAAVSREFGEHFLVGLAYDFYRVSVVDRGLSDPDPLDDLLPAAERDHDLGTWAVQATWAF